MPPESNDELDVLRRTNAELVEKSAKRKNRIAELEADQVELQSKLAKSEETLRSLRIDQPLQRMAESLSNAPDLFKREFLQHFQVNLKGDELEVLSLDGKPITDKTGVVPFERERLLKFLIEGTDSRAKTFQTICIASKASGAGGSDKQPKSVVSRQATEQVHFGIR